MLYQLKCFNVRIPLKKNWCNYNTAMKKINTDAVLPFNPQAPFEFCHVAQQWMVFIAKGLRSESREAFSWQVSSASFGLKHFLNLALTCMTLKLLKMIAGRFMCRLSLKLALSAVSSRLDSGYAPWHGHPEAMLCAHCILSGNTISICPTAGDHSDCLVRVVSARLLHDQVTRFPLCIPKVFCGRYF